MIVAAWKHPRAATVPTVQVLPPHAGRNQEPATVPSFCQDPPRCQRRGLESESQIFSIINLINF